MKIRLRKFLNQIKQTANFEERLKSLKIEKAEKVEVIFDKFLKGSFFRKTRGTNLNEMSSRSHCIFTIYLKSNLKRYKKRVDNRLSFS